MARQVRAKNVGRAKIPVFLMPGQECMCNTAFFQVLHIPQYVQYCLFLSIRKYPGIHASPGYCSRTARIQVTLRRQTTSCDRTQLHAHRGWTGDDDSAARVPRWLPKRPVSLPSDLRPRSTVRRLPSLQDRNSGPT